MYTPKIAKFIPNSYYSKTALVSVFPDFLAVVNKIKPCMSGVARALEIETIKKICNKYDLFAEFSDFKMIRDPKLTMKIKIPASDPRDGWQQVFIARSKEMAQKAKEAHFEHTIKDGDAEIRAAEVLINYGKILGYPHCCVDHLAQCDNYIKYKNAVYGALLQSKECRWELNNLAYNYYYIPYLPCSYDCSKSLEYVNRLKAIIKKTDPQIFKAAEDYLKLPYLFIDYNIGIVFNGKFKNNKTNAVVYSEIDMIGPVEADLFKALEEGNECRIFNDSIEIRKNNSRLKIFPREEKEKKFLLKFS